jgi:response regulator NasT
VESTLIVSHSEKSVAVFRDILRSFSQGQLTAVNSAGAARRLLLEQEFDLVIINAPLQDESGESLSLHAASKGFGQVILVVSCELFDEVSAATEDYGIITVAKPMNKSLFWSALKLAKAAQSKLAAMRAENSRLARQLEDMRLVNRAKGVLISRLNMSEPEAHKYIERQAMDLRLTKRAVAENILTSAGGQYED